MVESQPSKLLVAGSIPVSRSRDSVKPRALAVTRAPQARAKQRSVAEPSRERADVAQLVEHSLGKGEVTSSILVIGSSGLLVHGLRKQGNEFSVE